MTSLPKPFESRSGELATSGNSPPALRTDWVERIFSVLAAGFGRQFSDQWAGVDHDEMKALWSRKLAGFFDQPEAIRSALDSAVELEFPPNLGRFYAICQSKYQRKQPEMSEADKAFFAMFQRGHDGSKAKTAAESADEISALVKKMKMDGAA